MVARFNSVETSPGAIMSGIADGSRADAQARKGAGALHPLLAALPPVTVVTGHYGVGKTNLALNLAFDLAAAGFATTVVDLDVVNPYFRSSDHANEFSQAGMDLVAPLYAGTALDSPGLSGKVSTVVQQAYEEPARRRVVIDAGGDDVGATALGRFSGGIAAGEHALLFVVNERRNLTQTAQEAVEVLAEVQEKAHLAATGVVGNTHLQAETDERTVLDAVPFAVEAARLAGLPLLAVTAPRCLAGSFGQPAWQEAASETEYGIYPVDVRVRTPWDQA